MLKKSGLVLALGGWARDNAGMRGTVDAQMAMLSTLSTEDLISEGHPIRRIRATVDAVLEGLDGELGAMYPDRGRPSVPPEMLSKASVLTALYSIRSERAFCERLNYDMLFKWFLGMRIDERSFDASAFSKNRERLLGQQIADRFFAAVVERARLRRYCSSDHFSVDGTLLEAWASHKSFKPKDAGEGAEAAGAGRNAEADFPGRQAPQRHPPVRDRSRGSPVPQVQRHRGGARLHGASDDREPQRAHRRRRAHRC